MFNISCFVLLLTVPAILAGSVGLVAEDNKQRTQEVLDSVEDLMDQQSILSTARNCNLSYACYNGNHYYFETKTKRTRDDAAKFCRNINMNLISVDDCGENTFIANAIKNNDCYKTYFWTSGYRTDTDVWYWGTGDTFDYTNWMRAEPSYGKNQYCVAYHSSYVQWSDEVCSTKNYFVCESTNPCA